MKLVKIFFKLNDNVQVICGKDKGKVGKILKFSKDKSLVLVESINIIKKHKKSRVENKNGQILEKELMISISNIKYVCHFCDSKTKIFYRSLSEGNKTRHCCNCDKNIDSRK